MPIAGYDFAGWVTKNDIRCTDGVIIKKGAFWDDTPEEVPLVWNHQHNDVQNVIGSVLLEHRDEGTYGYGYFSNTDNGKVARELVQEGKVSAMSIGASQIKKHGNDVVHGKIFEVSLVLTGANPGAKIVEVMSHSAYGEDTSFAVITTDELIHSNNEEEDSDVATEETKVESAEEATELDVERVFNSLNEEQKALFFAALDDDDEEEKEENEQVEAEMKQSAFDNNVKNDEVLTHAELNDILIQAIQNQDSSLRDTLEHHGVKNIEMLFPEASLTTKEPQPFRHNYLGTDVILNGVHKSPMTRIKSRFANMTEDGARARGYITGTQKLDSVIDFFQRETQPQTVYVKHTLDRDYILDITDFDMVNYLHKQMEADLRDELARAILVGDGRTKTDPMKISEQKIRPVISEADFYKVEKTAATTSDIFGAALLAKVDYRGSGALTAFIHPTLAVEIKLLRGTDKRFLNGHVMTDAELAQVLGATKICETTLVPEKEILMLDLNDYTIGTDKGGQITNFDDFDIDFNTYKYLIETRISGSIDAPKSIIHIKVTTTEGIQNVTSGGSLGINNFNTQEEAVQNALKDRKQFEDGERAKVKGGASAATPIAGGTHA